MMMLLDWSGSMSDVLFDTVKQLINLVEFCRKVNMHLKFTFLQVKENMKIDMMKMVTENLVILGHIIKVSLSLKTLIS